MNTMPSPSQPEHAPADGLAKLYAQLYAIASRTLRDEQDLPKRTELERIVAFADSALSESARAMGSGGAPVPNLPAIAPPQPAAPAPGMPPAAPAGATPGRPQAPPPGAMPQ